MISSHSKRNLTLKVFGGFVLLNIAVFVVNAILGVGPNLLMKWLGVSDNIRAFIGGAITYGLRLSAYIALPALALQRILGVNPWINFFPISEKQKTKDITFGFLLVAGVLSLFFIAGLRLGWLALEGWMWNEIPADAWARALWVGLLVNLCVAVGEETMLRGYLLSGLNAIWGRWTSLFAMSAIFGLMHLAAYSESGMQAGTLALAIALASLFGILFGLVRITTGSLWLPATLHFAWNFIENDVLNLTGDSSNVNLVGAITRLQAPLTKTEMNLGNILFVEALAFAVISFGLWLWLRKRASRL